MINTYSAMKGSSRRSDAVARLSGSGSKQRRMKLIADSDISWTKVIKSDLLELSQKKPKSKRCQRIFIRIFAPKINDSVITPGIELAWSSF